MKFALYSFDPNKLTEALARCRAADVPARAVSGFSAIDSPAEVTAEKHIILTTGDAREPALAEALAAVHGGDKIDMARDLAFIGPPAKAVKPVKSAEVKRGDNR